MTHTPMNIFVPASGIFEYIRVWLHENEVIEYIM